MNYSLCKKNFYAILVGFTLLLSGCATTGAGGVATDSSKRTAVKVTQTAKGALITSDERILFDTGRADVKADGKIFVARVAKILKERTKADIVIEGHTDNIGGEKANLQLSASRADAVRTELIRAGIDGKRIAFKGFGPSQPSASNSTPEGRQANRRTEILVVGETVEKIGGASLGDRLSDGLENFLKDPLGTFKKVFE
ncbi:OmpA family protein [Massilia glaciei]|nr:OmpA family protein [Massilia glaciei]